MTIVTFPVMPPLGVAVELVPAASQADVVAFWLRTHHEHLAPRFWRTAVARECTPAPDADLIFEAVGAKL